MAALTAAGFGLYGCAPSERRMSDAQRQVQLASFEKVWTTIRDKHFDPTLGGLDWQKVHDELRPRMDRVQSQSEARGVMSEMIARLGQSHFNIIPVDAYEYLDKPANREKRKPSKSKSAAREKSDGQTAAESKSSGEGGTTASDEEKKTESSAGEGSGDGETGIVPLAIGEEAVVASVVRESAAAEAGVKPGWAIQKINDFDPSEAIRRLRETMGSSKHLELMLTSMLTSRFQGKAGEVVTVRFRDGEGQEFDRELKLRKPTGEAVALGNLPPIVLRTETRWAAEGVGYFGFSIFLDPPKLMGDFGAAMKQFMRADGLIIDLRGNHGGIGALSMGMAGWLVGARNHLGVMKTRGTDLKFVINPRAETFEGPVAILVDGSSASTSEIFAGGLKDIGRARIFGRRTAAAALPSVIERLPNGDGFQYAIADYISVGGQPLEGIGVIPDEEIMPTREQLLSGQDPVIDAAVRWIRSQKSGSSS